MRNQEFYILVAQVLPALLIAVMLEIRVLLNTFFPSDSTNENLPPRRLSKHDNVPTIAFRVAVYAWILTGASFISGEGFSLMMVFLGADNIYSANAAIFSWLALIELTIMLFLLPLLAVFATHEKNAPK